MMIKALAQAKRGYSKGEVPVGCVITFNNQIIAQAYNQPITTNDPTAHAEIVALRKAGDYLKNYRLLNTTLYVTLEPCAMCVGAMIHARIQRVVFAADDPKTGMICSCGTLLNAKGMNHTIAWERGILQAESARLLKKFFKKRR